MSAKKLICIANPSVQRSGHRILNSMEDAFVSF